MSITCSMQIPANQFQKFHEILVETNGRYIKHNPYMIVGTNKWKVEFEFGDYKKHSELWDEYIAECEQAKPLTWFQQLNSIFKA